MKALIFALLCLHIVKGDTIEYFGDTRMKIKDILLKTATDFLAFGTDLAKDHMTLVEKLQNQNGDGDISSCEEKLAEQKTAMIDELNRTLDSTQAQHNVLNAYTEFTEIMQICYDNLKSLEGYYSCTDSTCREMYRKSAAEQLEKAVAASNVRDIEGRITTAYPSIQKVVREYEIRFNAVIEDYANCKIEIN